MARDGHICRWPLTPDWNVLIRGRWKRARRTDLWPCFGVVCFSIVRKRPPSSRRVMNITGGWVLGRINRKDWTNYSRMEGLKGLFICQVNPNKHSVGFKRQKWWTSLDTSTNDVFVESWAVASGCSQTNFLPLPAKETRIYLMLFQKINRLFIYYLFLLFHLVSFICLIPHKHFSSPLLREEWADMHTWNLQGPLPCC